MALRTTPDALTINLELDEDGDWIVTCERFPGCIEDGRTVAQALRRYASALDVWLEASALSPPPEAPR